MHYSSYERFLELVWLDAAYEERLAGVEGLHEGVERLLELRTQRRRTLPCVRALNK